MKQFKAKHTFLVTALLAWAGSPLMLLSSYAQAVNTVQQDAASHAHSHAENEPHGAHAQAQKRSDKGAHRQGDGHHHEHEDEHGEGSTRIATGSARRMGIVVEKAESALIDQTVPLAGRIALNENTRVKVPARFPGMVRSVQAELGQYVEEGQVLAVVEANDSLREYEVVAPISGHVLERNTNRGDVASADPLFVIADLSDVWAKFHVFPQDASAVRSGQAVRVRAFHGDKWQEAKIDRFLPLAHGASQTQIAISALPNAEGRWQPGTAIVGDVVVAKERVPVAVKESALQKMEEQGDVVFVLEAEDLYEARPVKLGLRGGGYVEILEGIEAGQNYVAQGSFIIKSDILKSTATHSH